MPRIGLEATDRRPDPAALVVDVDDPPDLVTDLVAGPGLLTFSTRLALVDGPSCRRDR
jgi:hypothetical protein